MTLVQRILIMGLSVVLLAATVELIRRRKLKEQYSLLWLLTGIVLVGFALYPQPLYILAALLHFHYLTVLLLVPFLFLLGIILHYSTVISQQHDRETGLAQKLAIIEWRLKELEKELANFAEVRNLSTRRSGEERGEQHQ